MADLTEKPVSDGECTCDCSCCQDENAANLDRGAQMLRGKGNNINTVRDTVGTVFLGFVCLALIWALQRERTRYQVLVERLLK